MALFATASLTLAPLVSRNSLTPAPARRCAGAALSTLPTIADDDDDEEAALAREEGPVFLGDWDTPAEASRRLLLWGSVFVVPVLGFASVQNSSAPKLPSARRNRGSLAEGHRPAKSTGGRG